MDNPVEEFEQDGYTVKLYQDEDAMSPRENDNLTVIVDWHRRYELGDRKASDVELDALRRGGFKLLARYLRRFEDVLWVQPIGMLDHSGVTIWVGGGSHWSDAAGWDSGTVGFAYVTKKRFEELCGSWPYKPKSFKGTAEKWLEHTSTEEIEEYDRYLRGDVYGYVIEDEDGNHVDSCWGFIGGEYAQQEAKDALKSHLSYEVEQQQKLNQCLAL